MQLQATQIARQPDALALNEGSEAAETPASWCFWILLAYVFVRNLLAAAAKPLWYDELYTVTVSHQPTWRGILRMLSLTKDGNPPVFYFMERFSTFLPLNEQVAYRLASIVGFDCVLACLFLALRTRVGNLRALICTSTLMLTPLLRPYAVEARAYAMVVACIAFGLLCYQRAPRIPWMIAMGAAFMAAQSMHYLAFFGFIPFALAELAVSLGRRKIRWVVWASLSAGLLPIAAFWPFLTGVRKFYGTHIWSPPSLFALGNVYSLLLKATVPMALGVVAVAAMLTISTAWWQHPGSTFAEVLASCGEHWIDVALLAVPIMLYLFTKIMNGVYTERYALLMLLALPLCASFALHLVSKRGVAFAALFVFTALAVQEGFFWQSAIRNVRNFVPPSEPVLKIVNRAGHLDLPVAVSDALEYFQVAHYSSDSSRFVFLDDPPQAVAYTGSDIVDLQLGTLRCCSPFHIYGFQEFAAQHPSFLLYSGGGPFDWWPARLVNDGDSLELLASEQNHRVYLVNLKPPAP